MNPQRKNSKYVMGLDFGTDSVRALVVEPRKGQTEGSAIATYRRWAEGRYSKPEQDQFRQHPLDYLESMEKAVKAALERARDKTRDKNIGSKVVGLGIDTTGSTVAPIDRNGMPLALTKTWRSNPNAMFILWKDHTAKEEAGRINEIAKSFPIDFTRYSGGIYSSEWFFSKILHVLRTDSRIRKAASSWVEHCDWMTGLLVGNTNPHRLLRSRCAAGHKAMWHESWGGLPDQKFLDRVHPLFQGISARLYSETATSDQCAGTLTPFWAKRLGLNPYVRIAVGALDAHMGAVGAGIRPGSMCKIIGTSSCDMVVVPPKLLRERPVNGICGQVYGSILPGLIGLEAGQSSAGDAFAWLRDLIRWSFQHIMPETRLGRKWAGKKTGFLHEDFKDTIYSVLDREARKLKAGESGLIALDWFNGRRSPNADPSVRGALTGMNLGTGLPALYRAVVEAVAFGARKILDVFLKEGVTIDSIIACGGLSKIDFVMQVHSDILGKPIRVSRSDQTCSLGASIFAAVAAGIYRRPEDAQKNMCPGFEKTYRPDRTSHRIYNHLYEIYSRAGEDLAPLIKRLGTLQHSP